MIVTLTPNPSVDRTVFLEELVLGSVNRSHLATPKEWERKLSGADDGAAETVAAEASDGDGAESAGGGGVTTANGAVVPQKLIDRAKAARARLTA